MVLVPCFYGERVIFQGNESLRIGYPRSSLLIPKRDFEPFVNERC